MFERFTGMAREVVTGAQGEARRLSHHYIGTEHLLLSMLEPSRGQAGDILRTAGLTKDAADAAVRRGVGLAGPAGLSESDAEALASIGIDLEAVLSKLSENEGAPGPTRRGFRGHIPFTPRAKKVLELSLREALRLKHKYIGTEHILLGLIREGEGLAAKVIVESGIALDDLRRRTEATIRERAA
jgi:ATP-dependent Clp protease ATP-binding subunit ClpA